MNTISSIGVVLFVGSLIALGQEPPAREGSINGVVVDMNTRAAIPSAQVSLMRAHVVDGALYPRSSDLDAPLHEVTTDVAGKFSFRLLPEGSYTIRPRAEHYLTEPTMVIHLTKRKKTADVELVLARPGSISGRIMNEKSREMLAKISVEALRVVHSRGHRVLLPFASAITNDAGIFHLQDLPPAEYLLSIREAKVSFAPSPAEQTTANNNRQPKVPVTLWPSDDEVGPSIRVFSGMDLEVGDINVERKPLLTVRATLEAASCHEGDSFQTLLFATRSWSQVRESDVALACGETIEFQNVSPGDYTLTVGVAGVNAGARAVAPLRLGKDNEKLSLFPVEGLPISVLLTGTDGRALPKVPGRVVEIHAQAGIGMLPDLGRAQVSAEGMAIVTCIQQDARYRVRVIGLSRDEYVSSLRYNQQSSTSAYFLPSSAALGQRLEVIVSNNAASVSGRVERSSDLERPAVVVMAPWPMETEDGYPVRDYIPVDTEGQFSIHGLRPGRYRLFATDSIPQSPFGDKPLDRTSVMTAALLDAEEITLTESGSASVELKIRHFQ